MTKTLSSFFYPSPISTYRKFNFSTLKVHAADSVHYPLASKIIVKNLPYSADESCLKAEFSKFGRIAEVKLVKNEATNKSKGYAYIQYKSQEEAMLALESMEHQYFEGRLLFVDIATLRQQDFGGSPKASGPPQEQSSPTNDDSDD